MASGCAGVSRLQARIAPGTTERLANHADASEWWSKDVAELNAVTSDLLSCKRASLMRRRANPDCAKRVRSPLFRQRWWTQTLPPKDGLAHPVRLDPLGFLIDDRFGDLGQGFVGCFLFIQRFLQQGHRFVQAQFFCPGAQCTVA